MSRTMKDSHVDWISSIPENWPVGKAKHGITVTNDSEPIDAGDNPVYECGTGAVTKGLDPTVEMKDSGISWIGEMPSSWEIRKIKHCVSDNGNEINVGPFGSLLKKISQDKGECSIYGQANLIKGDFSTTKNYTTYDIYRLYPKYQVHSGDVLVSMMGTIGKCLIVPDEIQKGIIDSHLIRLRLDSFIDPSFFEYVYDKDLSDIVINQLKYYCKGSIMDGLNIYLVSNVKVPVPPLSEQKKIISFLDQKCRKIDQAISVLEKLISEEQEYQKSLITGAVTKGLDPTVEMKDSGISWIGEMPSSWEIRKIKHCVSDNGNEINVGPFGSLLKKISQDKGECSIYGQANLIKGDFSTTKNYTTYDIYRLYPKYQVHSGDVLVSMMGTIGKCLIVPDEIQKGIIDSHLIRLRLDSFIDPSFFEYVYDKDLSDIVINQLKYYCKGSIMDGLNIYLVSNVKVPVPPLSEQKAIVRFLNSRCKEINQTIKVQSNLVEELKEYKKSLIYEYVTGKKEVLDA